MFEGNAYVSWKNHFSFFETKNIRFNCWKKNIPEQNFWNQNLYIGDN